ncbi:hypothetical protein B0H10DRAFT_2206449 [Mycena sp. CBHHK59/15]|nr:hypothetical protein B0H10DRAFT_2206449 [Mycena sp. CBHHK59/15]
MPPPSVLSLTPSFVSSPRRRPLYFGSHHASYLAYRHSPRFLGSSLPPPLSFLPLLPVASLSFHYLDSLVRSSFPLSTRSLFCAVGIGVGVDVTPPPFTSAIFFRLLPPSFLSPACRPPSSSFSVHISPVVLPALTLCVFLCFLDYVLPSASFPPPPTSSSLSFISLLLTFPRSPGSLRLPSHPLPSVFPPSPLLLLPPSVAIRHLIILLFHLLMRTCTTSRSPSHTTGAHNLFPDGAHFADEDAGDYLFTPDA